MANNVGGIGESQQLVLEIILGDAPGTAAAALAQVRSARCNNTEKIAGNPIRSHQMGSVHPFFASPDIDDNKTMSCHCKSQGCQLVEFGGVYYIYYSQVRYLQQ